MGLSNKTVQRTNRISKIIRDMRNILDVLGTAGNGTLEAPQLWFVCVCVYVGVCLLEALLWVL